MSYPPPPYPGFSAFWMMLPFCTMSMTHCRPDEFRGSSSSWAPGSWGLSILGYVTRTVVFFPTSASKPWTGAWFILERKAGWTFWGGGGFVVTFPVSTFHSALTWGPHHVGQSLGQGQSPVGTLSFQPLHKSGTPHGPVGVWKALQVAADSDSQTPLTPCPNVHRNAEGRYIRAFPRLPPPIEEG